MASETPAGRTLTDSSVEPAATALRQVRNGAPVYLAECIQARVPPRWGGPLNESDYVTLDSSWITREIADAAMLRRVDEYEGREVMGQTGKRDCAGILVPYYWPGSPHAFHYRLRRDKPEWGQSKNGEPKPERKYLSPPNAGNRLFIPPGVSAQHLSDLQIPIALVEGEKKGLALWRLACYEANILRFVPIALAGVWNWRGRIGKTGGPKGERLDVKGQSPTFTALSGMAGESLLFSMRTSTPTKA